MTLPTLRISETQAIKDSKIQIMNYLDSIVTIVTMGAVNDTKRQIKQYLDSIATIVALGADTDSKWLSRRFTFSRRRLNLSWTHHKKAAILEV